MIPDVQPPAAGAVPDAAANVTTGASPPALKGRARQLPKITGKHQVYALIGEAIKQCIDQLKSIDTEARKQGVPFRMVFSLILLADSGASGGSMGDVLTTTYPPMAEYYMSTYDPEAKSMYENAVRQAFNTPAVFDPSKVIKASASAGALAVPVAGDSSGIQAGASAGALAVPAAVGTSKDSGSKIPKLKRPPVGDLSPRPSSVWPSSGTGGAVFKFDTTGSTRRTGRERASQHKGFGDFELGS